MVESCIFISQGIADGKSSNIIVSVIIPTAEAKKQYPSWNLQRDSSNSVLDRHKKNKDFLPEYCYSKNLEPTEIQKLLKAFDQHKDIFASFLKKLSSTHIIQTHHSDWKCSYNTKHSILNVSKTKQQCGTEIDDLMKQKLIQRFPNLWALPVVLVPKPGGKI